MKANNEKANNLFPFTYKNDTYGRLTELYDRIKNYELPENSGKLFFEIHFITNEAIDYAKSTELKTEKYNTLERMLKVINEAKHNIDCVSEKDIFDLEDGFNFDLGNKPIKFIEGADEIEKKLRKAIEPYAPTEKKNAGRKSVSRKNAEELLIKINYKKQRKDFLERLRENFADCNSVTFGNLIFCLKELGHIKMGEREGQMIHEAFQEVIMPKGYKDFIKNKKEGDKRTTVILPQAFNKAFNDAGVLTQKNNLKKEISNMMEEIKKIADELLII